ncbi:MAG: DUF5060 domain-containing protein, partial [Chloroflexi bacterium]|nr:DUF5060 domain-containing protein [Chloroflexota bacterium]
MIKRNWFFIITLSSILFLIASCSQPQEDNPAIPTETPYSPIHTISTNEDEYSNQQVPQYNKLELTFQVDTTAVNLQLPYDAAPPAGVEPETGISIDAHFTPDNWETIYIQPGFYYQEFVQDSQRGDEWIYPTSDTTWKVRFAPNTPGEWQGKLVMVDANGRFQTQPFTFTVAPSDNPGFIRVSEQDSRYFEFEDGTYFPGLGMNLELPNALEQLPVLQENGIQLIRTYLPSQYSIWGGAWSPWRVVGATQQGQETNARLRHDASPGINLTTNGNPIAVPKHDTFLWLSHDETMFDNGQQRRLVPCAVMGWNTPPIPVQPNTEYRVRVRYRTDGMEGPKVPELPFGLTVKTDQWLWHRQDETQRCSYPGTGDLLVASYADGNGRFQTTPDPDYDGWSIMEGTFSSGDANFLPRFWLAIENATAGNAYIDHVWVEPITADGSVGANIVYKASMAPHLYFDQRSSFAFDQALTAAEQHELYLKLV